MTARRIKSLHFGDMEGKNVVFHREHRSKRGRKIKPERGMRGQTPRNSKKGKSWRKFNRDTNYDRTVYIDL